MRVWMWVRAYVCRNSGPLISTGARFITRHVGSRAIDPAREGRSARGDLLAGTHEISRDTPAAWD